MDTRTPRLELNGWAAEAGKLGITGKQNILDFAEAANTIRVALGEDLGEDAILNIGKLANMFGEVERSGIKNAMLAVGSAVNQVGQSSMASEKYLVEFTARMAGTANQAGMSISEILGYGKFKSGDDKIYKIAGARVKSNDNETMQDVLGRYIHVGQEVTVAVDDDPYHQKNNDADKSINAAVFTDGQNVSQRLME